MSIDKDYKVLIHLGDMLIAAHTLHTEFEDGEYVDVSITHIVRNKRGRSNLILTTPNNIWGFRGQYNYLGNSGDCIPI